MQLLPELITFLSAMLPVTELRGAIPFAMQFLGLSPLQAFIWSVLGNMFPMFFILAWLDPVTKFLMKHSQFCRKIITKIFERTHQKHSKKIEEVGLIALMIFVAVPIPGSGAWTGCLIAFICNLPYWKALGAIFGGIIIAGIIMTVGFTGLTSLFNF